MPVAPTYPGVYIEEVPSGVRTIVGVATSITAFVGLASRGPTNQATRIQSFADFERTFGGLHRDSMMSYAVSHFFANGGSDAIIVRIVRSEDGTAAADRAATTAELVHDALTLTARSEGRWGSHLRMRIDHAIRPLKPGEAADELFNLTLEDTQTGLVEEFRNVSAKASSSRFVKTVLEDESTLVEIVEGTDIPDARPSAHITPAAGDPFADVVTETEADLEPATRAVITLHASNNESLKLEVKEVGTAGNQVQAQVAHDADDAAKFTLTIRASDGTTTDYVVSITGGAAENVKTVVNADTAGLVTVLDPLPTMRPDATANFVPAKDGTDAAVLLLGESSGRLKLQASLAGEAGKSLRARIDHVTTEPRKEDEFNLYVENPATGLQERFLDVSVTTAAENSVKTVVNGHSKLVNVVEVPTERPQANDSLTTTTFYTQATTAIDGGLPAPTDLVGSGNPNAQDKKTGIHALEDVDLFNLLCLPPLERGGDIPASVYAPALDFCATHRAMLLVDSPAAWKSVDNAKDNFTSDVRGQLGSETKNAAFYFPRLKMADSLRENRPDEFVASGAVAGMIARTDAQRGVWKAPAGIATTLAGIREFSVPMTDKENGLLNPLGINCLRNLRDYGNVIWGARTMEGADQLASEWKYLPVRRLTLFMEESLYRGTHWVVFEPNDEPLWAQIRLNVGAFMQNLFRQGAFQGRTAREAYFVRCDKTTTTQNDINLGIVNIEVGFAPLKPAEFVVIKIQQIAGEIEV